MFSVCYTGKISRFARNDRFLRLFTGSSKVNAAKKHEKGKGRPKTRSFPFRYPQSKIQDMTKGSQR